MGKIVELIEIAGLDLQFLNKPPSKLSNHSVIIRNMDNIEEFCFLDIASLVKLIFDKDVKAEEVIQAHVNRIEKLNGSVNAVVTFTPEKALKEARMVDQAIAAGRNVGPLAGIPVLYKDLTYTKGVKTTFGSPIYENFVPSVDSIIVERLKKSGAISLGKTNTPEFGAGSQTFNNVFGSTKNPYDLTKTCGGSSGGSAVAVACGFSPIADGTDFGGSLRNPASFCNVVGFRPSSGVVPVWPKTSGWFPLSVSGPMARTVKDLALMLSVMAGYDERDPISLDRSGAAMLRPLEKNFKDVRVAWSPTLGGLPVEAEVLSIIESQRKVFESLGCIVEEATPDLSDADEIFEVMRAWHYDVCFGELFDTKKSQMKDTVLWNIEEGKKLSGTDLAKIENKRTKLHEKIIQFQSQYDYLIAPAVQVLPFDVDQPFVTEINNVKLDTYIEWMRSCYRVSVTGLPAMSVPCGFSKTGLPVGVQIVGGFRKDFSVLQMGHAFESVTKFWQRKPVLA